MIYNRKYVFFLLWHQSRSFSPPLICDLSRFRLRLYQPGVSCLRWVLHSYLAPQRDALEAPLKIHHLVKLTLFLIIIHCRQQVSKDNYHSFQKGNNSGHCAKAVIDLFCCAGRLNSLQSRDKMRKDVGVRGRLQENMNKWLTVRTRTSDSLIITACMDCKFHLDALICCVSAKEDDVLIASKELLQREIFQL